MLRLAFWQATLLTPLQQWQGVLHTLIAAFRTARLAHGDGRAHNSRYPSACISAKQSGIYEAPLLSHQQRAVSSAGSWRSQTLLRMFCAGSLLQLYMQGHIWRLRLLTVMLRAQVLQGSCWPDALAVSEQITPFYKQLYPQAGSHHTSVLKAPVIYIMIVIITPLDM